MEFWALVIPMLVITQDKGPQGLWWITPLSLSLSPCRFAMEPLCPLLLASFSLPLARASKENETTPAESNRTNTTTGRDTTPLCHLLALDVSDKVGR